MPGTVHAAAPKAGVGGRQVTRGPESTCFAGQSLLLLQPSFRAPRHPESCSPVSCTRLKDGAARRARAMKEEFKEMPGEPLPEWKGRERKGEPLHKWGALALHHRLPWWAIHVCPLGLPLSAHVGTDTCLGDPSRPSPHFYQMPVPLHPMAHMVTISDSVTPLSSCSYFSIPRTRNQICDSSSSNTGAISVVPCDLAPACLSSTSHSTLPAGHPSATQASSLRLKQPPRFPPQGLCACRSRPGTPAAAFSSLPPSHPLGLRRHVICSGSPLVPVSYAAPQNSMATARALA